MKLTKKRVLELLAQVEVLYDLLLDPIARGEWFGRLTEPEKRLIEKYQTIRDQQQQKLLLAMNSDAVQYGAALKDIPDYFEIEVN